MRFSKLSFIVLLLLHQHIIAQDGSNIRYINMNDLDRSYIGKETHFDFYNASFAAIKRDTVTILINNKPVLFIEHREDDGFNNWFSRQYLEEFRSSGDEKLRLLKSVIKEITKDSILVTNHFSIVKGKNNLEGRSFTQDNWFNKNIIIQVLVHSEQCCK